MNKNQQDQRKKKLERKKQGKDRLHQELVASMTRTNQQQAVLGTDEDSMRYHGVSTNQAKKWSKIIGNKG